MNRRVAVDWLGIVALPVVSVGAFLFLGGYVDQCLSSGPNCAVHPGISPWVVVVPATVLWLVAALDIARTRGNR
jgi:hypothetical protein